jgi:histidyl-tRNA synthetase
MEALGVKRGDYVVRVNNRKVLDGVMEVAGIGAPEQAGTRLTVLRAIDKLDKIGPAGVRDLLGAGRWENPEEKSGDFTKGAGLADAAAQVVLDFVASGADAVEATIANLRQLVAGSERGSEGVTELETIAGLVAVGGYAERVKVDPSVVRGLEYYTGPVFEAELTFQVTGDDGQPVRFGSVGGGGRYDGLVGRFLKDPVPATGFSIGVSRLAAALKTLGKLGTDKVTGPVCVLVMDKDPAALADYQAMVAELRQAGVSAEMYLGASGMKAQMKYADRRNAPCAVIVGSSEREAGKVQIKDLALGKELSAGITDNAEWRASRPAQKEVARADLVAEVRAIVDAVKSS